MAKVVVTVEDAQEAVYYTERAQHEIELKGKPVKYIACNERIQKFRRFVEDSPKSKDDLVVKVRRGEVEITDEGV